MTNRNESSLIPQLCQSCAMLCVNMVVDIEGLLVKYTPHSRSQWLTSIAAIVHPLSCTDLCTVFHVSGSSWGAVLSWFPCPLVLRENLEEVHYWSCYQGMTDTHHLLPPLSILNFSHAQLSPQQVLVPSLVV